jgi:ATP-dependent Lon protease
MNEIDPNKYLDIINKNNKKCNDSKNNIKKYLKGLGIRSLTIAVIFFLSAITCKYNNDFKETITKYVFTDVISFTKIKKVYNKYLGGILPIKKEIDTNQKEYLLREKIKVIKQELGDITIKDNEIEELKKQLNDLKAPTGLFLVIRPIEVSATIIVYPKVRARIIYTNRKIPPPYFAAR